MKKNYSILESIDRDLETIDDLIKKTTNENNLLKLKILKKELLLKKLEYELKTA